MKRLHTRLPGSIEKIRLDQFLAQWLPEALGKPVSRGKIRTLLFSGGVYINRHRNKNGTTPLYAGAVIEVYIDENKLNADQPLRLTNTRFETSRVIFEDDAIIVVNKPAGIPSQPTIDPGRANLYDLLKSFLAARDHKNEVYLGMHHRLDRDTSGLILFTKKEEANKGVADLFMTHQIFKYYQCLCWKSPVAPRYRVHDSFKIENFLAKVSEKTETSRFGAVHSGGDYAVTGFRVIEEFRDALWLEAQPETGRTHQIRVHASEHGIPILGDPLYFPEGLLPFTSAPRLMLHAGKLEFKHPMTQAQMTLQAPLPEDFMNVLGSLK